MTLKQAMAVKRGTTPEARKPASTESKTQEPDRLRPADKAMTERHLSRLRERATVPHIKVAHKPPGPVSLEIEASKAVGSVALFEAMGTTNGDFANLLLQQLLNATTGGGSTPVSELELNGAVAAMAGIAPRDEAEAMLVAQMVAINHATMIQLRRLKGAETIPQLEANGNLANKLARTYAAQMEALKRYRSKGEQRVIVERVNVGAGGQAIVGAVAPGRGPGVAEN